MKNMVTSILILLLTSKMAFADLILEAKSTDNPFEIVLSIINKGTKEESLEFPIKDSFPYYHTWSPFHWRVEGNVPRTVKKVGPTGIKWETATALSSKLYTREEWLSFYSEVTLQPSEKITYKGDIRKIVAFVDWSKVKGEVKIIFRYSGVFSKEGESIISNPLKITI